MKFILFYFLSIAIPSKEKPEFTPPKWEGHWEAYSAENKYLLVGSLDIVKLKGKEYSWKLMVKSDFDRPTENEACPEMKYEGLATYNGANGLNTNVKGIGFVYYQETGFVNVFHDYSDKEITDLSLCFDPGNLKRVEK